MKKGWKIFWIVCAALACAGILLAAAGAALGGLQLLRHPEDISVTVMPGWLERIVEEAEDGAGGEARDVAGALTDGGASDESYIPPEADGDRVFAYDGVRELSLDVGGVGVLVLPWDGDEILVDLSEARSDIRENLEVSQEEGKLRVESRGGGHHLHTNDTGMLYISVPRGAYYDSVSADVGMGFLEVREIAASELSLEVGAGQIVAEDITAVSVEADCGAGQIIFSGDVETEADINCDIGEVLYTAAGTAEDYDYELSCSVGELVLDGEAYSALENEVVIENGSERSISAECRMGRIEIMFEGGNEP